MKKLRPKEINNSKFTWVVSARTGIWTQIIRPHFFPDYVSDFFVTDIGENTWMTIFIDPTK